ncbi:MAG TPA: hypothetical protein VLI90_19555 [Tepidisphaeraceae bacterium]|nr:hypothetical protein [Tepidisphaeraceae bacterium]
MISAESAIRALRRDLTVASLLKGLLVGAALLCLIAGPVVGSRFPLTLTVAAIGAIWLILSYRSAKGSSLAADSPLLIASGQFDEAEHRIEQVLRTFSIFRTVKLLSLHHLAVLRHAQRRWRESALLSEALLHQRLGSLQGLSRSSRLMLADSLMELGDLRGAHAALVGLYNQRLTLAEAMNLLAVQLDYESRVAAWPAMVQNLPAKVQLAELMPSTTAARAQSLLALAARKTGRDDWSTWLRRRAELLVDVNALVAERPLLKELWSQETTGRLA